jgi:hypothetical protein
MLGLAVLHEILLQDRYPSPATPTVPAARHQAPVLSVPCGSAFDLQPLARGAGPGMVPVARGARGGGGKGRLNCLETSPGQFRYNKRSRPGVMHHTRMAGQVGKRW